MTNATLEAVARAIWGGKVKRFARYSQIKPWDQLTEDEKSQTYADAQAAIDAMPGWRETERLKHIHYLASMARTQPVDYHLTLLDQIAAHSKAPPGEGE